MPLGEVRIGPKVAGAAPDDPVAEALVAHRHVHAFDRCDVGHPLVDQVRQAVQVGATSGGTESRPAPEGVGRRGDGSLGDGRVA